MRDARREQEFTDFVASRQAHLRRIAYAVCGDWHRADDLLQTALTKLYVAWPRVRRDGREEAYVAGSSCAPTSTSTAGPGAASSRARRPRRPRPPGLPVEERSALFEALQALPVMQRKTVVLRHWLGLSVEETAAELGIATGTVKSHTSRACHVRTLAPHDRCVA